MAALPPKPSFTGSTVTQGQFKTALDTLNDYLTGLFGADGSVATARSTLNIVNPSDPTYAQLINALGYTPYSTASAAGKLDKAGGAMTGNLTMTGSANLVSSRPGDNARDTGFKMADGQDLGEMNRANQYYDDLAGNCNGYLPSGNCAGNNNWTPPHGDWWTWGVSGVPTANCANWGSYDGAAGTSQSFTAVSVAANYDAYTLAADEIGGGEYRRNVRNCNCGGFNCRTNCNCDCVSNCACDCV